MDLDEAMATATQMLALRNHAYIMRQWCPCMVIGIVNIMCRKAYPVAKAGPKARAGFMQADEMGPKIHMLVAMIMATARGPSFPHPLQRSAKGTNQIALLQPQS